MAGSSFHGGLKASVWAELLVGIGLGSSVLLIAMVRRAKTDPDRALENDKRRRILDSIRILPGIHQTDLAEAVGTTRANLQHHLFILKRATLVWEHSDGWRSRYFVVNGHAPEGDLLSSMLVGHVLEMGSLIALNPGCYQRQLTDKLRLSRKSFRHHVQLLKEHGLVEEVPDHHLRRYYPTTKLREVLPRVPEHLLAANGQPASPSSSESISPGVGK